MDDQVDHMCAMLSELLPDEPDAVILDAILRTKSVMAAFDLIASGKIWRTLESSIDPHLIHDLCSLFPSIDRCSIVNICHLFGNQTRDEIINIIISQFEFGQSKVQRCSLAKLECGRCRPSCKDTQISSSLSFVEAASSTLAVNPCDHQNVKSSHENGLPFEFDFGVENPDNPAEDPSFYRQAVQDLISRRGNKFERAAEAFQRGGLTGRAYASYLASDGHDLTPSIEALSAMAALATLRRNNPNLAFSKDLDLHGLTVRESQSLVIAFIRHHLVLGNAKSVRIITGHGRGSVNGARLRPSVMALLRNSPWSFSFDNFAIFTIFRDPGSSAS